MAQRTSAALLAAVFGFGLTGAASAAEGLSIDVVTFENGRFVIAGTAAPGADVSVVGTTLTDTADVATGAFRITRRTVLPACRIDVQAGEAKETVDVAHCHLAMVGVETPQPVTLYRPRGIWNSGRAYKVNDVVEFDGRHWRATADGKGRQPALAGAEAFWVAFDPVADAMPEEVAASDAAELDADTASETPPDDPAPAPN